MAEERDEQEKTEEPSQHRIEEFRGKGQVASSKELNSLLILAASTMTLMLSSLFIFHELVIYFEYIGSLDIAKAFQHDQMIELFTKSTLLMLYCCAPIMIVVFIVGF